MGKLILTSKGLNSRVGRNLIGAILSKEEKTNKTILLVDLVQYEVRDILFNACLEMGFEKENIIFSDMNFQKDQLVDYVYVTEGNTFEVLQYMRENHLPTYIQNCVANGATYIGCSAGALIAGVDIKLALDFDTNFVRMHFFQGLGLFDGTILPHYEPEHLARYIENSSPEELAGYKKIYSVGNEEALVMLPSGEIEHLYLSSIE